MTVFLASLTVLFSATLAAYWITRLNSSAWDDANLGIPWGMLTSTALLIGVSAALESAKRALRKNQQKQLNNALRLTAALAVAFLIGQTVNWVSIQELNTGTDTRLLSLFTFYLLTGVHALHVLGGLIPLGIVLHRAAQREYSSSRDDGVRLLTQYWHFLLGVWMVLLVTMYLT
jgi:cytochrome c oxidase subunit 3